MHTPRTPHRHAALTMGASALTLLFPLHAWAGPPSNELATFVSVVMALIVAAVVFTLIWHIAIAIWLWRAEKPSLLPVTLGALTCMGDGLSALGAVPMLVKGSGGQALIVWGVIVGVGLLCSALMGALTRRAWLRAKAT